MAVEKMCVCVSVYVCLEHRRSRVLSRLQSYMKHSNIVQIRSDQIKFNERRIFRRTWRALKKTVTTNETLTMTTACLLIRPHKVEQNQQCLNSRLNTATGNEFQMFRSKSFGSLGIK